MTAIVVRRRRSRTDYILRTAARGAVLVGVAIVVGAILLKVVDKGSPSPTGAATVPVVTSTTLAGQTPLTTAKATTATTKAGSTTTVKAGSERPASAVRVWVYNGSGTSGAALNMMNKLAGLGYAKAGTGNATANQTGNTVQCKTGFDKEAATLAKRVGGTTTVAAFPSSPSADLVNTDCVVTVGK
jgi:hypothetical protein